MVNPTPFGQGISFLFISEKKPPRINFVGDFSVKMLFNDETCENNGVRNYCYIQRDSRDNIECQHPYRPYIFSGYFKARNLLLFNVWIKSLEISQFHEVSGQKGECLPKKCLKTCQRSAGYFRYWSHWKSEYIRGYLRHWKSGGIKRIRLRISVGNF